MKICSDCKEPKALNEFQKRKSSKDGRSVYCKKCISLRTIDYHHRVPEKHKKNTYNYKYNHPEKKLLYGARSRAKDRGTPITITCDDIIIPEFCPILGVKLERNKKFGGPNSPSLDCIIPELGYVPGNIAVISRRANTIKNDASLKELEQVVKWLKSHITG